MRLVTRKEIISDIHNFFTELSKPFSAEDINGGWTNGARDTAISFFKLLELDLKDRWVDSSKRDEYATFIRGIDSWGITDGPLMESALNISHKVCDLTKIESGWLFWRRWFS